MSQRTRAGLLFLLAGVSLAPAVARAGPPREAAALVNGVAISHRQVVGRVMQQTTGLGFHDRFTEAMMLQMRARALDQLIEEELLHQRARRLGLLPSDRDVAAAKAREVAAAGGARAFARRLQAWHLSWDDYWGALKRQLAAQAVLQKEVIDSVQISEPELRARYRQGRQRFRAPPQYRLQQLLVGVKANEPRQAWDDALSRARSIVLALRVGADFDKLASQARHSNRRIRGGTQERILANQLPPEVARVAASLEPDKVSDPIRTGDGYMVIVVKERRIGRELGYAEVASRLRKLLVAQRRANRRAELVQQLRTHANILRRY